MVAQMMLDRPSRDGIIRLNTRFLLGVKDRDGECPESGRVRAPQIRLILRVGF